MKPKGSDDAELCEQFDISQEELEILRRAFDEDFYCQQSPGHEALGADPFAHFLTQGWKEGYDPSPDFSTFDYLDQNPDVVKTGANPFIVFMLDGRRDEQTGKHQDRSAPMTTLALGPDKSGMPLDDNAQAQESVRLDLKPFELKRLQDAFDPEFYALQWVGGGDDIGDPLDHFLRIGWKEGRNPSVYFSVAYYLNANPDVREAGLNPFVHWVLHGHVEGRAGRAKPGAPIDFGLLFGLTDEDITALRRGFDVKFYLARSPDVAESGANPLAHYLLYGWHEQRDPSPEFSTSFYCLSNGEVAESGVNPFLHWLTIGKDKGLPGQPQPKRADPFEAFGFVEQDLAELHAAFDPRHYRAQGPQIESGEDPLAHYLRDGWKLGLDPSREFSTDDYLASNEDVADSDVNPFVHWVLHGRQEGRDGRQFQTLADEAPVEAPPPPLNAAELGLSEADLDDLRAAFDADFYAAQKPGLATSQDPLAHYLREGWKQGLDPSGEFSTREYLADNEDVAASDLNPFAHWVLYGRDEGRDGRQWAPPSETLVEAPLPLDAAELGLSEEDLDAVRAAFDADYYASRRPGEAVSDDPLAHYLREGWKQGLDPSPEFSSREYLAHNQDVAGSDLNPFVHWVLYGHDEGRDGRQWTPPAEALVEASPPPLKAWELGLDEADLDAVRSAFDADFYAAQRPGHAASDDPLAHYLRDGWKEGLDPSPEFSTGDYLAGNEDVAGSDLNPFVHWVLHGRQEGRDGRIGKPQPEAAVEVPALPAEFAQLGISRSDLAALRAVFDAEYYEAQMTVRTESEDLLAHYLRQGWREGLNPSRDFSTQFYLYRNGDISGTGMHPFLHWALYGKAEGRPGKPVVDSGHVPEAFKDLGLSADRLAVLRAAFDPAFYQSQQPAIAAGGDPLLHYLRQGWRTGLDPSPEFSTTYYLTQNSDVARTASNPFVHWIFHGRAEGRRGRPPQI